MSYNDVVYRKRIGKYELVIEFDNSSYLPREEFDNFATLFLPEYQDTYSNRMTIEEFICDGYYKGTIYYPLVSDDRGVIRIVKSLEEANGAIYVTKKVVKKEFSVDRISKKLIKRVLNILEEEIDTYNDYIEGNVYGYTLYEIIPSCIPPLNEVSSCWGFYGDDMKTNGIYESLPSDARELFKGEF